MEEVNKILYIVVFDKEENNNTKNVGTTKESFRYTRALLQSTLLLIGCKPRHAFKISKRVFESIRSRSTEVDKDNVGRYTADAAGSLLVKSEENKESKNASSELYRMRTTVSISREKFLDVVCDALDEYKYFGPNQREDLILACRLRERKGSLTVLLCGTSGCGKSTLSSILASKLGITTVISTDSIRHMMRSFVDEKNSPLLWASTYHAGECLDPVAVAEAKARRKARKMAKMSYTISKDQSCHCALNEKPDTLQQPEVAATSTELTISPKQLAVEGFKAQSEMVIESLERLITTWEERKESVIIEGVHLSLNFVMGLMKKHPSIVPFMIYITNEDKHLERFAVRAKYMTLDPSKNKYVKYIRNIRRIQDYLCNRADKHLVPKINNTNVDKSVAAIHATLFSCLRRREAGEKLYDPATNTVSTIHEEYKNQCAAHSWSSKGIFQLIQRKGSSRRLMAFVNDDGSIAKAWPIDTTDSNVTPTYGCLHIGKAEPVNLQFGHFGVSAWPSDTGGTSYASSLDDSRTDWACTDTSSRCYSSCCSSPRLCDGLAKRVKEELLVSGSDEEVDEPPEVDSDEDLSDGNKYTHEEIEGSIDEESEKSDEECDEQENAFNDEEYTANLSNFLKNNSKCDKFPPTLNMFLRAQSLPLSEQNGSVSSLLEEKDNEIISPYLRNLRTKQRSFSISAPIHSA